MNEEAQTETADSGFPAQSFIQARESQGLSIEQVCRLLHLSRSVVEAIEKGDLQKLSDPVFSRGYIRSYARLLKLDADHCVACYNRASGNLQTAADVKAIGTVSTVPGRHRGRPLLKIGTWLFVAALIAVSVWWWQTQQGLNAPERDELGNKPLSIETSDGKTLVLPSLEDQTVSDLTEPDGAEPVQEQDEAVPVPEEMQDAPASAEEEGETLEDDASLAAPADQAEPSAAADTLDIVLSDDCWISIREIGGRTLFNGVAGASQPLSFQSDSRLSVVIGKVSAVSRFSYQGQEIDLTAMSKDDVARLSLPL